MEKNNSIKSLSTKIIKNQNCIDLNIDDNQRIQQLQLESILLISKSKKKQIKLSYDYTTKTSVEVSSPDASVMTLRKTMIN